MGTKLGSLTLRQEHRLRVFENRVLRRIFGPNRDRVIEDWRKLVHNEELRNLYSSPSIIRMIKSRTMRWAEHVTRKGEKMNTRRILVGKSEGKRPLGRQRRRWMDNIKMVLRGIDWGGMNWIDLAQDRNQWRALVDTVMNFRVPLNFGKF
jgi:glucose dehydrogenase